MFVWNFCDKKLQTLEIGNFVKISSNFHFFLIFTKLKNYFWKIFKQSFAPNSYEDADVIPLKKFSITNKNHQFS